MAHHNIDAEKLLFGCILIDNSIIKELELQPDHFSFTHGHLYKAMLAIDEAGEPIDWASLSEKLGPTGLAQYDLADMKDSAPSAHSYKTYEKQVIRGWKAVEASNKAKAFIDSDNPSEENLSVLISQLNELEQTGTKTNDFDLGESLVELYEDAISGKTNDGIKTGFYEYDRMTGGHAAGQLIIVAARPSVGKTAFALNVALGHMNDGAFGHLYSLEMAKKGFLNRMLSSLGNIDAGKLRDPAKRFNEQDWNKYSSAMSELRTHNMYIGDKSSVTIPEIYARTRKLMREYPDQEHFVMIDYLQLLKPMTRKQNREQEVSEMSRSLKNMAMDLGIPVIALSQLSRGVESRQDKRPMLSDIRESGSIEQDADVVAFLYRDDYYDKHTENQNIIEIIIGKQREGAVGTVELVFTKEYNKFGNLERRYDNVHSA